MATFLNHLVGTPTQIKYEHKLIAWQKATIVAGTDPATLRKDSCGAWIKWSDFGNTNSQYGWEVDHIFPISRGGNNHYSNLQALHWRNNRAKGDSINGFTPAVVAV